MLSPTRDLPAGESQKLAHSKFDGFLRKLFPSTSRLTFNPLFRLAVNALDLVPRPLFPEFAATPPNHLRVRVGVGNRIVNNQVHYLVHARDFWLFVFSEGLAKMDSSFLDIGVGCGRFSHWLRDYNFRGRQFRGTYVGVDIDPEAIAWCRAHFDAPRFRFHLSSDASVSYHQEGHTRAPYRIPEPDGSFDLVFSNSLFTHLLEAELENYLRESHRLLKPGGTMLHPHFSIDYPPATFGKRHSFSYRMGNARVESLAQPEAAVAYTKDYLFDLCRRIGFASCEILHMPGGAQHQPVLLCRR